MLETLTLLILLANSYAIRKHVFQLTHDRMARRVASLCLLSLALCFGGDLVNFNLSQSYYQHGDLIKHDYLADSVWFFAPGYLLLHPGPRGVSRRSIPAYRRICFPPVRPFHYHKLELGDLSAVPAQEVPLET